MTGFANEEEETVQNEITKDLAPAQTYDIFLGKWATELEAVLQSLNVTWTTSPSNVDSCRSYLFHIPETERSAPEMVIAAHYVALHSRKCVLCIRDMVVEGSDTSPMAVRDYNRARAYLRDLATRERATLCDDLRQAVTAAADIATHQRSLQLNK